MAGRAPARPRPGQPEPDRTGRWGTGRGAPPGAVDHVGRAVTVGDGADAGPRPRSGRAGRPRDRHRRHRRRRAGGRHDRGGPPRVGARPARRGANRLGHATRYAGSGPRSGRSHRGPADAVPEPVAPARPRCPLPRQPGTGGGRRLAAAGAGGSHRGPRPARPRRGRAARGTHGHGGGARAPRRPRRRGRRRDRAGRRAPARDHARRRPPRRPVHDRLVVRAPRPPGAAVRDRTAVDGRRPGRAAVGARRRAHRDDPSGRRTAALPEPSARGPLRRSRQRVARCARRAGRAGGGRPGHRGGVGLPAGRRCARDPVVRDDRDRGLRLGGPARRLLGAGRAGRADPMGRRGHREGALRRARRSSPAGPTSSPRRSGSSRCSPARTSAWRSTRSGGSDRTSSTCARSAPSVSTR